MANTLTLTVDVLTKNAKELDKLIDRVDDLNKGTGEGAPKAEKFGSGIDVATLAAGAAAVATGLLAGKVADYVKSSIDAAARTEGLRNGLRAVIPDAGEFEATLARIDKQARLPGLQKNDLLRFTTSMTAAGLTSNQTESALTILGSRITGFGQTSAEAAQVVGQFTQAMNRGKIEGDELNRLFETLPGFKNIVIEMTGVTGGAQDLNDAFAAQGKTVQEGIIPLLEAYDDSLGAIKHDAALTKADAYEGALEDLRNTIGEKLLPIYKEFLDRGAEIVDNIAALITGATSLPKPILDIKDAFDEYLETLKPLIEPLENLGNSVLPLLKTIWEELVGVFVDLVIPTYGKILEVLAPVIQRLIELATPIANLIKTYLPPLVSLLKTLAGVIIDVVLVPLRALAGALGWVIEKITDLINLIPGAKTNLETAATASNTAATASNTAATAADKQATATESVTDAVKTQKSELEKTKEANKNFAEQAKAAAVKQTELKIAVAASNIELKNAKTALKDATNPEEIESASKRVVTAIENNKNAKVSEAQTFDDESKKQIAILKAESDAQSAHETAVKTASENREQYAEELTEAEEDAAKDRELAIENEVNALSTLITNYTQSTQTEFTTRSEAFRAYKNKRVALSDEIIKNIESSEMTEAEKAAAIRKTHEDLAKDLTTEWGKITTAEKTELEAQKTQAEEETKAKAEIIKAQNDAILTQTEAYLIRSETAYGDSFGRSEKEQEDALDRLLVTLTTHHAAEIKAAEDQGKDTAVLEAKHDAEIEKLQDEHLKRLKKQNDSAAKEENKARKLALDDLKSLEKDFFTAVDGATREFHSNQTDESQGFYLDWNTATKEGLQVFKDAWQDILADIVDLGKQYLEDMKEIRQIEIEAEQGKQELFAEMSERYYEIERESIEKLRELAQERVKIYEDAKDAIRKALDDHAERLVGIEKNYNDRIIEINEDAVDALKEIGIDSNRDRLDDALDFHEELESIEDKAQQKREDAAEDHEKRIKDIADERNKDLLSASRDFVGDSLDAFNIFQSAVGGAGDITDIVGAQERLNETIGNQLQGIIRSVIGDEADALFSVGDFDAFDFLGIRGTDLTSDNFISTLVSKLPGAIGRLREGELLDLSEGGVDAGVRSLAELLQGTSVNESTGGILGAFRDAGVTEDARYLEVLDGIDQWEIAANEVILNTQSLIVQTGIDRTTAEGESLTQRDDETQVIAEGQNQAQADITFQEIEIKQSTRDALDQLFLDYTNRILEIDAETRAAIKAAQKQASDDFWKGVIEIGGTVLGVAAGAAITGLTGGAVPPNIAIGIGAQLGKAGGNLLADAVIDDDEQQGFHNPIHDHLAFLEGQRSGQAASGNAGSGERRQFYAQQAEDFSGHFGKGFQGTFSGGRRASNYESVFAEIVDILNKILEEVKTIEKRAVSSVQKQIAVQNRTVVGIDEVAKQIISGIEVTNLGEISTNLRNAMPFSPLSGIAGSGGGGTGSGRGSGGTPFTTSTGPGGGQFSIRLGDYGSGFPSGLDQNVLFNTTRRRDLFNPEDYSELYAADPELFEQIGAEGVANLYPELYRPDFDSETGRNRQFSSRSLQEQFSPEEILSQLTPAELFEVFGKDELKNIFTPDQLLGEFSGEQLAAIFGTQGIQEVFTPRQLASQWVQLQRFLSFFPPAFLKSQFGQSVARLIGINERTAYSEDSAIGFGGNLFDFAETDMRAKQAGIESGIATHTQLTNAIDFSKYFGEGFVASFAGLLENSFDFSALNTDAMPNFNTPEIMIDTSDIEVFLSQDSIDEIGRSITKNIQQNQTQQQPRGQKLEVTVEQRPPSDNFLLAENDRTKQLLEARDI